MIDLINSFQKIKVNPVKNNGLEKNKAPTNLFIKFWIL